MLQNLTGWHGSIYLKYLIRCNFIYFCPGHQVLYFGDHPYSDLADVTLEHGWRTGAILGELEVS